MIEGNVLSEDEPARLTRIARDGLEDHRVARRANAILPLDRGRGCERVRLVRDLSRRRRRCPRELRLRWWPSRPECRATRRARSLGDRDLARLDQRRGTSCRDDVRRVLNAFGSRQAVAAIDVVWRKPELVPSHLDLTAQNAFVDRHEKLRNGLGADEAIVYGDAVHPTHQTRPAGVWMPRDAGHRGPCSLGRRPDEHPRCDRPGDGRDADEGGPGAGRRLAEAAGSCSAEPQGTPPVRSGACRRGRAGPRRPASPRTSDLRLTEVSVLDTSVVSELRRPRPHGAVLAWLEEVPDADPHLSAATIGEIQAGIAVEDLPHGQRAVGHGCGGVKLRRGVPLSTRCRRRPRGGPAAPGSRLRARRGARGSAGGLRPAPVR